MFGIIVSGRPAAIAGAPGSGIFESSPGKYVLDIVSPGEVADISLFLTHSLPNSPGGDPTGLAVYFSVEPFQEWQFLTAISNAKPSVITTTGWPLNPAINECKLIRMGISVEPASVILPKLETVQLLDFRRDFARKIALNLFRFIESFSTGGKDAQFLRCPQDVLDRWLTRFDEKYKRDPNFILHTN